MSEDVRREMVPVSDRERSEVAAGLQMRKDALEKERKKVEELGVATGAIDAVLAVHRGNGASGGLAARFARSDTAEMFPDVEAPRAPQGKVRQLVRVQDDAEALLSEPLEGPDGEPFELSEVEVSLTTGEGAFALETVPEWDGQLVEDEAGHIFRVRVGVQVTFDDVGQRPSEEVDAAVEASDAAAEAKGGKKGKAIDDVDEKKLEALRKLAVAAIEAAATLTVKARKRLVAYAQSDADAEWVRGWTARDVPLGQRPHVPDDWEPSAEPEAPATSAGSGTVDLGLEGLNMTAGARTRAEEEGLSAADLARAVPTGSGSGGRYVLADVVAALPSGG